MNTHKLKNFHPQSQNKICHPLCKHSEVENTPINNKEAVLSTTVLLFLYTCQPVDNLRRFLTTICISMPCKLGSLPTSILNVYFIFMLTRKNYDSSVVCKMTSWLQLCKSLHSVNVIYSHLWRIFYLQAQVAWNLYTAEDNKWLNKSCNPDCDPSYSLLTVTHEGDSFLS